MTRVWRGHLFDRWDLIAGSTLVIYFLTSFLFHPNGYIKPASCVMYWAFTTQGFYNWYKYRTTPPFVAEKANEREIGALWQAEYECLSYDYEEVMNDIDLLLWFMLEQGYSDCDWKRQSSKWIFYMSHRAETNPKGAAEELFNQTNTLRTTVPQ